MEPSRFADNTLQPEFTHRLKNLAELLGTQGLVGIALAAIDMALWDALARVHGVPLVRLLGGAEKPLRPYGAVGYDGVEGCAKAAEGWASEDLRESKPRSATLPCKRTWPLCVRCERRLARK